MEEICKDVVIEHQKVFSLLTAGTGTWQLARYFRVPSLLTSESAAVDEVSFLISLSHLSQSLIMSL